MATRTNVVFLTARRVPARIRRGPARLAIARYSLTKKEEDTTWLALQSTAFSGFVLLRSYPLYMGKRMNGCKVSMSSY